MAFEAALVRYRAQLAEAHTHLTDLGLEGALDDLDRESRSSEFRVAVLGRFNRGKSTFINALLGDRILPTDVLPCTSAIIELRAGGAREAFRCRDGDIRPVPWTEFLRGAGSASSPGNTSWGSSWRVAVPTTWIPPGFVLVDTPGTDEDALRNAAAVAELRRCDAAVVLLDVEQVGSLEELQLIEEIQQRVGLVIIGLNRADKVTAGDRERVLGFARKRIAARVNVPQDRIVLVSGQASLNGDPWAVERIAAFRGLLSRVLLANTAGAKLRALGARTEHALRGLEPRIHEVVATAVALHGKTSRDATAARDRHVEGEHVLSAVRGIFAARRDEGARVAAEALRVAWPRIVHETAAGRDRWQSDCDPLFSPKQFASEVAEAARADLVRRLEKVVKRDIQAVIESRLEAARNEARKQAKSLIDLGASSVGGEADRVLDDLDRGALQDAFGAAIEQSSGTGTETAVATVVSAIVGYLIADIILFYVMGIISGFLAPPLLIAAAVTGGLAYLVMGRDWVRSWVRSKIADTLEEQLTQPDVVARITFGVGAAARDVFERVSKSYEAQLRSLLKRLAADREQLECAAALHRDEAKARAESMKNASAALSRLRSQLETASREIAPSA